MFKSETPDNIMDWKVDDVWKLVQDEPDCKLPKPEVRLRFVKMLYDVLGLTLTPDVALAAVAMPRAVLSMAPAGGGKTTWAQIEVILYKLLYPSPLHPERKVAGKKILCLVYNKHNVADMTQRHEQLIARMKIADIKGLNIDDEINACTMHSFCDFIRRTYIAKLNMVGFTLLEENQAVMMMERSIRIIFKKLNLADSHKVSAQNVLGFYTLCRECLKSPEKLSHSDKFHDIGLSITTVQAVFSQYESAKKTKCKYDYVDMVTSVASLLERDGKILANVQKYFDVIVADEVQDFTPIMWKLLRLFVSDGTPLTCIGDVDQCIYHFRGASMQDLLYFSDNFCGGKVYSLLINRRCRELILKEAMHVIAENTQRFDTKLVGTKDGGNIETIPYSTAGGQILNVKERLKKLSADGLQKSVCCFREQKYAQLLVDVLEEENIPFHSLQQTQPFSHELYRHMFSVLDALEMPYDRDVTINLYKVLPCSRKDFCAALSYSEEKRRFTKEDRKLHFAQYDYGHVMANKNFAEVMYQLVEISSKLKTEPLSSYVDVIFGLLDKYFWKFRKEMRDDEELDSIFEERVRSFFHSNRAYPSFFGNYRKRVSVCSGNNASGNGVTVSTFHGLKGLEFENVFALFMDDRVFPNYSLIESREYSAEVERDLKESETRLWYVVVTRAVTNLVIYYAESAPSKYVQDYLDRKNGVYVRPNTSGVLTDNRQIAEKVVGDFDKIESRQGDFADDFSDGFDDSLEDDFSDSFEDSPTGGFPDSFEEEAVQVEKILPSAIGDLDSSAASIADNAIEPTKSEGLGSVEVMNFNSGSNNDYLSRLISNL